MKLVTLGLNWNENLENCDIMFNRFVYQRLFELFVYVIPTILIAGGSVKNVIFRYNVKNFSKKF